MPLRELTAAQLRVPDKTNEITCFAALLEPYGLAEVTVTADALHNSSGSMLTGPAGRHPLAAFLLGALHWASAG